MEPNEPGSPAQISVSLAASNHPSHFSHPITLHHCQTRYEYIWKTARRGLSDTMTLLRLWYATICTLQILPRAEIIILSLQDIMNSIFSKLQLRARSYFALAIEYSLGARSSRVSLLRPETKIVTVCVHSVSRGDTVTSSVLQVTRMPNSDHLRCVFRFAFIPKDIEALWLEDPRALDYYYQQCTADVVRGRYAFEMR